MSNTLTTRQVSCPACMYVQQAPVTKCCECGASFEPIVPANLADLRGDQWQALSDQIDDYEASIMTPAQKAFAKLVTQHAEGLLTATDLWAETCEIVLANQGTLFPDVPTTEPVDLGVAEYGDDHYDGADAWFAAHPQEA